MAGWVAWSFVALAVASSLAVFAEAIRRPILFRMAARNAGRRPKQTATVIAGLMVGTAIISAALVAGGSAGSAIRGAVYDALGEVDETVRLDSFSYFPEAVYEEFRNDPTITDYFDGISTDAIWQVTLTNPRVDLYEPEVSVIAFEPETATDFRPFELTDGSVWDGTDIRDGEAVVTAELAEAAEIRPGDRIELRFTPPIDPIVPDITWLQGTVQAAIGGTLVPTLLPSTGETHTISVDAGASAMTVAVGWDPRVAELLPPTTSLQLRLDAPDGTTYTAPDSPVPSFVPVILNVTPDDALAEGDWTLTVTSPAAAQVDYFGAAAVLYPVYDPMEIQERTRGIEPPPEGFPDELRDMATELASYGDPRTLELKVRAVTDGGRGDQFDFGSVVFMGLDQAQEAFDRVGEVNVIKLSNPGDAVQGQAGTPEALERINATLDAIKAKYPDDAAVQALDVFPVKENFVNLADDAGQLMTGLLLFAGSLTVITGLLLIINIFTMLAEERRSELGMSRAVGLQRGDLVRLFLFEGSLYAVAAAALGAVLGLGLAAAMVAGLNSILAQTSSGFPPIPFQARADDILIAFSAGALLTFVTIAVASRRVAKLNIVRAIRRIDEPDRTAPLWQVAAGFVVAGIGVVALAVGWSMHLDFRFTMQVGGGLFLVGGSGVALRRWVARKPLYPGLAAVLCLYYTATYFFIQKYDNMQEANIVGPIRGVLLTLSVVVIVVHFESGPRALARVLARFKRLRAIIVTAFSYPQHKRFRTGMTLSMFSIVLLSIGFFSIFGGLFDTDPERQTGGFDVEAGTTLAVDDLAQYDRGLLPDGLVAARTEVLSFSTPDVSLITVDGERTGQFDAPPHHHVYGITEDFVDAQSFRLLWRLPEYETDADAYRALFERDDAVIVSYAYSTDEKNQDLSHEVGETLRLHLGDDPLEYTIVGIQEQWHYGGIWLPRTVVEDLFPSTAQPFYLYKLTPGSDAVEAAKLLERNYRDVGMDAEATREKVLEEQEAFRQILGAMKLFLGLGLIIGVLSLGIVTSRSVLERRQEIGMLRALGYTRNMIRRTFVLEVTLVLATSAAIGIASSIVVSFGLWWSIIRELQYPYVVPWGEIGWLLGVSYVVAMLATLAPIRRAARTPPAEALRYIE